MEGRQSDILPSNAPALLQCSLPESNIPSNISLGVLKEKSHNLQHELSDSGVSHGRKYMPLSPTENAYTYNQTYLAAHANVASEPRELSEIELDRRLASLWRYLQRCDGYRKYRARQPKDAKDQEQKWPEHMELAFFRALIKWRPMGRRKKVPESGGKPRGRNELIAEEIKNLTGEVRGRKQVSSHIQVLKHYVKDHPKIMKLFSTDDHHEARRHRHALAAQANMLRRQDADLAIGSDGGLQNTASNASLGWQGGPVTGSSPQIPCANTSSSSNHTLDFSDFEMFIHLEIQDGPEDKRAVKRLHTFTRLCKNQRNPDSPVSNPAVILQRISSLPLYTPFIMDCDFLVVEASLQMMMEPVPPGEIKLGVQLGLNYTQGPQGFRTFRCRTDIFDNGIHSEDSNWDEPNYDAAEHTLFASFASKFWAARIASLTKTLRDASKKRINFPSAFEKVRNDLKGLVILQKFYGFSEAQSMHPLLTIAWTFKPVEVPDPSVIGETIYEIFGSSLKEEEPEKKDLFAGMGFDLSSGAVAPVSQPFDHQPFELDALSSMALGMSTDHHGSTISEIQAPSMTTDFSQDTSIDFTGGPIAICMEPAVSIEGFPDTTSPITVDPMQQYARQWSYGGELFATNLYPAQPYAGGLGISVKDEVALPSAEFFGDALPGLRGERGLLNGF